MKPTADEWLSVLTETERELGFLVMGFVGFVREVESGAFQSYQGAYIPDKYQLVVDGASDRTEYEQCASIIKKRWPSVKLPKNIDDGIFRRCHLEHEITQYVRLVPEEK